MHCCFAPTVSQPLPLSIPCCCSGLRNLREAQKEEEEEENEEEEEEEEENEEEENEEEENKEEEEENEEEEEEEEPSGWGSSLVERMEEVGKAPRRRQRSTQGWRRGPGFKQPRHLMSTRANHMMVKI